MVASAELQMIISLIGDILSRRPGRDLADVTEAALRTAKLIELGHRTWGRGAKASPQLIMAVGRFLMSAWEGSNPIEQREYVGLLEQLMEHHLASAQAEKSGGRAMITTRRATRRSLPCSKEIRDLGKPANLMPSSAAAVRA
jgi:hypothetical protein